MLTFTEEILLLLLDDKDGSFVPIPNATLGCAIAGAVLMDLAFDYRIDTDPESLVITDRTPTGNPILDPILTKIAGQEQGTDTRTWIRVLSVEDAPAIREQALQSLVARGIVVQREARVMWAFRTRRYPTIDGNVEQEVKLRIGDVLFSDDIPHPRDVALIGLVDACDILNDIFPDRDMEQCRPRIDQLRNMDLIGRELASAIADIEQTVMMSLSGAPY
ncbi:MAG: GPP34 family phosphoprotein [Rhodospirillales bacterium]|nr:GPP34 family phosphoprotein [Rhodospirillales bacterium]MDE0381453.1 GPP34 family phosphoprotein [Rhodospirillales bacterium]